MSGRESTSGISHGSEPFARYASESRKTGVRYLIAIRAASIAASKQPDGVEAATTGTGDSEFRPKRTMSRSACSGFVGMPVDGPARWTSTMTSGSSSVTASPTVSDLSTTPGPGRGGHAERAAERRAERGSRGRDLVLGLERAHAEVLQLRELLEDVGRRRDRVRAEEEREPGELARRDQPVRQRRVARRSGGRCRVASCAGATSYEIAKSSEVSP